MLVFLLISPKGRADLAPIQFVDVTEKARIHFRHYNGAKGQYHLPETIGSGGAFFDYDNDGDPDLYLVNGNDWSDLPLTGVPTSVLFRNNGDGTFTDVTALSGIDNQGNYGHGVTCSDYDNDGDVDVYVTNFGANVLYRNNGNGTFKDITEEANVGDTLWSTSATFLDYDNDGYLDLYVVNYVHYSLDVPYLPCGANKIRTYCHPSLFEGAPDRLYRNNGNGIFTDVTEAAGIRDIGGPFHGKGLGVVAADFNDDRTPDIYVANDDTPNYFFYNNGDGTFSEIALLSGCAYSFNGIAQASMGVDAADYNGDGLLDIFVTNLSYETNALYRNNGDGTFTDIIYEANLGKESYLYVGFGTGFFDYDNDGYLDIFIANGHVIDTIEQTSDVVTYAQPNQLFHNNQDGTFSQTSFIAGTYFQRKNISRGAIFGDYDNDGDLDIVVTQSNGKTELLQNEGGNRQNWVRLQTVGTISNRDGIGTRVIMTADQKSQVQEVHAGSSYLCSNDSNLSFGLGDSTMIDLLEIRWPSGIVQFLENIPANQKIVIKEENGQKLLRIVRTNDIEAFRLALNQVTSLNTTDQEGKTALMIAAEAGYVQLVKLLMEHGANVNQQSHIGTTALLLASHEGHSNVVKTLIAHDAKVNAKNVRGNTALMAAIMKGHMHIVRLLLESGIDPNIKNMEGNTALIFAVHTMGHAGITKLLIESGADVSAENNENETSLMYASWNGKKDTVKLLLANGANVDKKNKNGDTALVLAETKGHTHIIRLLKNAGSK
ncbi:TPA: hypothetical protein EYG59_03520 [Candidatus Poribacteria bacterium]|nr:hypothetical protein [Candidatus Poribacteria bacterium]